MLRKERHVPPQSETIIEKEKKDAPERYYDS